MERLEICEQHSGTGFGSTLKRLKSARHILVTKSLDSSLPIGQSVTVLKNSAGHLPS
jgi:hypothetical protein